MRKLGYLLIATIFAFAIAACQPAESGDAANKDGNVATVNDAQNLTNVSANDANAANNPPQKPEYQKKAEEMSKTTIEWKTEDYDFGKIPEGEKVVHKFSFKNTGKEPLELTRVKPSCGCTASNYTKEPIAPGKEGFVEVTFDSSNKTGMQTKTVTVTGNFDGNINKILKFRGEVEKKEG